MAAVDIFADLGIDLYEVGRLGDGLELLAHRLDYAGAGELVAELLGVEFSDTKRDPKPVPTPKPAPPPKPPKGNSRPGRADL